MKNVQVKVEGNILTLTVDLSKDYGPSKSSGKTNTVASTEGFQGVDGHDGVKYSLNVNRKP